MNSSAMETLYKLTDMDETVANPEDDVRGRDVRDRAGSDLGKVKDLLIDPTENRVRIIEVASGGSLGIGQDEVFIPVDAITSITSDEVRIDQTRERIAGAPVYDPELIREPDTYGGLYDYYGFQPFWYADYTYPGYPFYPR